MPSATPLDVAPRTVAARFGRRLVSGELRLQVSGSARRRPRSLVREYPPSFQIDLFGTEFHISKVRQNEDLRFMVAYVVQGRQAFARLFYKDVSLIWRSASHVVRSAQENWIGKGDVVVRHAQGDEWIESDEATTDLPLEMQSALESLIARSGRLRRDDDAPIRVLRRGPDDRVRPYRDFSEPRRRAAAQRGNLVNGGRSIARFTRRRDPTSLLIVPGYEPDFRRGVLEAAPTKSRLYGGKVTLYRVLSRNMKVQWGFFLAPKHAWLGSLQSTTAHLTSFGVRPIDVAADEDLLLPGFEYHYQDESEDPPVLVSQIPMGFAGPQSSVDAARADASPWLDQVPVLRALRRAAEGRSRR